MTRLLTSKYRGKNMDMLNNAKAWLLARWAERTSWDGGVIVGLSLGYLLLGGLVDLVAWLALAYGIYTFIAKEV
jgi:hypothetical protein